MPKVNNIKLFFDQCAKDWDCNNMDQLGAEKICEIHKTLIKEKNVLDIGCGTGVLYDSLIKYGAKSITAIDLSFEMIKIARQKYKTDIFKVEDIYTWKTDKKFDTIIMYNMYPHLTDKEKLVDICSGLLNNYGHVIVGHGASKENINSHHKAHAMCISNKLLSTEEESLVWTKKFKLKDSYDKNDLYYFSLQKNT